MISLCQRCRERYLDGSKVSILLTLLKILKGFEILNLTVKITLVVRDFSNGFLVAEIFSRFSEIIC